MDSSDIGMADYGGSNVILVTNNFALNMVAGEVYSLSVEPIALSSAKALLNDERDVMSCLGGGYVLPLCEVLLGRTMQQEARQLQRGDKALLVQTRGVITLSEESKYDSDSGEGYTISSDDAHKAYKAKEVQFSILKVS